eukprot:788926-Prymnesium_polylepis.1
MQVLPRKGLESVQLTWALVGHHRPELRAHFAQGASAGAEWARLRPLRDAVAIKAAATQIWVLACVRRPLPDGLDVAPKERLLPGVVARLELSKQLLGP